MLSIFRPLASVSLFPIPSIIFAAILSNVLTVSEWNWDKSPLNGDGKGRAMPTDGERRHFLDGTAPKKSFRGHKLLRLNPRTAEQHFWLRHLYDSDLSSSPPFFDLDFWQPPASQRGALVDLTVSESDSLAFLDELKRRNFEYWLIADDLEELIEKETGQGRERESFWDDNDGHWGKDGQYRYDRYNPLTRIEEQLYRLREANPRIVTLYEIGRTHENRSIVVAKVSAREHFPDERFRPYRGPAVWVDAGIHAREWIAPATAMLFLARLIDGYNARDPNIRYLVESIDWYIAPVLNPDGYEYSHTKNRMWRKNRRPAFCKQQYFNRICCSGVDLNRNFDWFWSTTGSSADPCHETYHGPSAFSEPEARSVRDFLENHSVKAFFTFHSYSQLWLIPYGHKRRNYPEDYAKIQRPLSLRAVQALKRLYGTEYQVGSGADLLYEASGASHDFAKGSLNIPYSFLVELRPQNTLHSTGFLLPEAEITDTADETWEAVKMVADEILQRFGQFGEERKAWNVSTTVPTPTPSSTTEQMTEATTMTTTTATKTTTVATKSTTKRRTTAIPPKGKGGTTTGRQPKAHKRTFKPNTTTTTSRTTAVPTSNSTAGPSSSSVRNAKSGTKMGKQRPTASMGSSSAISSAESGGEQKTIVNVKICTGGRSGVIPPFPSPSTAEESGENGRGEEGTHTLMEILLPKTPRRLIQCRDWSAYCKWWRMHSLCADPRVSKMCTLSCLIECQI